MAISSSNNGVHTMSKAKRYNRKKASPLYLYAKVGKHKMLPKLMAAPMLVQRKAVWDLHAS
eukprot:4658783-Ditylum_brightwellii.AAC.1